MRELATIQTILALTPIDGADKIELARIKDWQVVVQKGLYEVNNDVVYFEIDSFLPDIPPFEFLLKGSSLKKLVVDGVEREGIRLKTVKLRGQVSQGLIMPLKELTNFSSIPLSEAGIGDDVTEALGVYKYERPLPAELTGKAKGLFPSFIPKTDEERIQNMGEVLGGFYVTEKLDGTSFTAYKKGGVFGICSRNLELLEVEGNTQWRLARELDLENKLPDNFALQGELVGAGIQNNPLRLSGQFIYFFNAYNIESGVYLDYWRFKSFCDEKKLEMVPILDDNFALPPSVKEMLAYAEGMSVLNKSVVREGVVVRPKGNLQYKGRRLSFKAISNKYLLEVEE